MKKNELNQLKSFSSHELVDKAKLLKKEIADAIFDKNMKKLKDTKTVFKKRKDLAKVLTILRQKHLLARLESEISKTSSGEIKARVGQSGNEPKSDKGVRTGLSK